MTLEEADAIFRDKASAVDRERRERIERELGVDKAGQHALQRSDLASCCQFPGRPMLFILGKVARNIDVLPQGSIELKPPI